MPAYTVHYNHSEEQEFKTATDGWKWRHVLEDLDNDLRQFIKHGDNKNSLDIPTMMDIREMIYNKMSGENLSFD
jgi:hypothetical protein